MLCPGAAGAWANGRVATIRSTNARKRKPAQPSVSCILSVFLVNPRILAYPWHTANAGIAAPIQPPEAHTLIIERGMQIKVAGQMVTVSPVKIVSRACANQSPGGSVSGAKLGVIILNDWMNVQADFQPVLVCPIHKSIGIGEQTG